MKPQFEIVAECPHTHARAGLLHTTHGVIETPVFMPVGTQAAVKALTPKQLLEELDAQILLSNTYHLYLRPGCEVIESCGGLHSFMSWPRGLLTDSGGYQVYSLASLRRIKEEGVEFQSHVDGTLHILTPESALDIQRMLGSDIMMVLDECTAYPVSESDARKSMELSLRWAERAFMRWRSLDHEPQNMLFAIVQGSMYADLRRECAERLLELDAPGYAVGGLSVGEPRPLRYEMASVCDAFLPKHKPRYVMGVGMLHEIGQYVALGLDMMDCVVPTRHARNGCLFTNSGRIIIKNAVHAQEDLPVDPDCGCYTCRNFSRAYLRHLFLTKEILYNTLSTLHNVAKYLDRMRQIRQAIISGYFSEYLSETQSQDGIVS